MNGVEFGLDPYFYHPKDQLGQIWSIITPSWHCQNRISALTNEFLSSKKSIYWLSLCPMRSNEPSKHTPWPIFLFPAYFSCYRSKYMFPLHWSLEEVLFCSPKYSVIFFFFVWHCFAKDNLFFTIGGSTNISRMLHKRTFMVYLWNEILR